jgi:hypothetical protein
VRAPADRDEHQYSALIEELATITIEVPVMLEIRPVTGAYLNVIFTVTVGLPVLRFGVSQMYPVLAVDGVVAVSGVGQV